MTVSSNPNPWATIDKPDILIETIVPKIVEWDINTKLEMNTILNIPFGDDEIKSIQAIIIDNLAVHMPLEGSGWRITHVPTLTKFDKALPPGLYTKAELIEWCKKVQEGMNDDAELKFGILQPKLAWNELNSLTPYNYDEIVDGEVISNDAKRIVREYCLGVKV